MRPPAVLANGDSKRASTKPTEKCGEFTVRPLNELAEMWKNLAELEKREEQIKHDKLMEKIK